MIIIIPIALEIYRHQRLNSVKRFPSSADFVGLTEIAKTQQQRPKQLYRRLA